MKHYINLFFILFIVISFSCSRPPHPLSYSTSNSEQLKLKNIDQLQRSILKITSSAYYQNYYYSYPTSELDVFSQESLLENKNMTSNSVAGTGLILYQDSRSQLLLSCHHLFDFKDTLKTYYLDKNRQPTKYLSSLSIKTGENILIFHKNGSNSQGNIIAVDKINDLAMLEVKTENILLSEYPFQGLFVDTKTIKFGQEVYLLGFPKGFFMVTRGLVSHAPYKNKFIVDAPFNRGFSGGVVVLFSENGLYYHNIGMANSVAYNPEIVLTPADDSQSIDIYKNVPYNGEVYVKDLKLINYGITFVIKSNFVIDFFKRERKNLRQMGYDISGYIK